jgi:glutamyl-Q tRNA(Asp) synthetase
LPEPVYHHHRLIRDAQGKRLAKRDNSLAVATLRERGMTAARVLALIR